MTRPKSSTELAKHRLRYLRWGYLVLLAVFLIFWRSFLPPDVIFLMFVVFFVLLGQGKRFIRDFTPFILILVSYDSLRAAAASLHERAHYTEMIRFDTWLGQGQTLTYRLQHLLYHGHVSWYDYYFSFVYILHFVAPIALGVIIWKYRPAHYWRYVVTFSTLAYAGFLTFLLFPAAPPWLASDRHLITPILKLSDNIWSSLGTHSLPTIYSNLNPNEVAAVPSLHVAFPVLFTIFVYRVFGWRWGTAFAIYPLSMVFGVTYMGEHYLFDALVGIIYAFGAYGMVAYLAPRIHWRPKRKLVWAAPLGVLLVTLVVLRYA